MKKSCGVNYNYYSEPDSQIRNKFKVLLDLLSSATCVDTCNLATKSNLIVLQAKVNKLDINKMVNVPTSLKKIKTKTDDNRCW